MADPLAQDTVDAVPQDGITALDPSTAVSNIDAWIRKLGDASFSNASQVRDGLQTLKSQLQATPRDANAIGQTLTQLGQMTTEAAGGDATLSKLGSALTSGGAKLTGKAA